MGWWSATIMGGDDPLDAQYDILLLAGLVQDDDDEFDWEENPELAKTAFETVGVEQWQALFDKAGDRRYGGVLKQVVALMHMQVGAALPKELAEAAITASETESDWSWRNPEEREARLAQFISIVQNYDGTPTEVPEEGLMDKIADHLSSGGNKPKLH